MPSLADILHEKGKEEGIKEGRKEGIKEGIKEGRKEAMRFFVKNAIREDVDLRLFGKITGLSMKEIKKIAEEIDKE